MKCCFLLGLLFVIGLLNGVVQAAETGSNAEKSPLGSAWTSSDWNAQASIGYLPSADLHDASGEADMTDYRLKLSRNIKPLDQLTLTLGAGYGLKHIDASAMANLPHDLHALFLEAGCAYRFNDKTFASLRLTPGFYSDFKDLSNEDLRMPVLALAGYTFDNGLSAVGGFIYRFGYHSNQFIPAIGFSYQPNQTWRFDLMAPRPGITYFASRQLQLFVAGDFSSDEYELKDRAVGAKALKYNDYKAMVGFNYLPVPAIKFSTSLGYAFDRRFVFYDTVRPDLRMDDVPFFKISLDVGW